MIPRIDGILVEVLEDWLFHTTDLKNLAAIARSRRLLPGGEPPCPKFVSLSEVPLASYGRATLVFRRRSVAKRLLRVEYTAQWQRRYPQHARYILTQCTGSLEPDDIKRMGPSKKRGGGEREWVTAKPNIPFPFGRGELVAVACDCDFIDLKKIRSIFKQLLPPQYVLNREDAEVLIRTRAPLLPGEDPTLAAILKLKRRKDYEEVLSARAAAQVGKLPKRGAELADVEYYDAIEKMGMAGPRDRGF